MEASLASIPSTHAGYFSQDNESTDEKILEEVEEILVNKEKLLTIKDEEGKYNVRRFIFSKWALKEGWDNPNVFTIAKLRSSGSETSKLQEVGRGLRLPVNEYGERVSAEPFYLNYIVDYSEKQFVAKLIGEINGDTPESQKINLAVAARLAGHAGMDLDMFIGGLMVNGYIDRENNIKEEKRDQLINEYPELAGGLGKGKIRDNNKVESISIPIRKDRYSEISELWEKINQKFLIKYEEISDEFLIDEVYKILKDGVSSAQNITSIRAQITNTQNNRVDTVKAAGTTISVNERLIYKDFLKRIYNATNLPIKIIHSALVKYSSEKEIPEEFFNTFTVDNFKRKFYDWKLANLIQKISYQKLNLPIHPTKLTDSIGNMYENISQFFIGEKLSKAGVPDNYLYGGCAYDSDLEKENIINGNIEKIVVFGKIPRKSIRIPTILSDTYSPDFMYVVQRSDGSLQLNLIIETKDKLASKIDQEESIKMECAKKLFQQFKNEGYTVEFRRQVKGEQVINIIEDVLK